MSSMGTKEFLCERLLPLQAAVSLAAQQDAAMKDVDIDYSYFTSLSTFVSQYQVLDDATAQAIADNYHKLTD